jgi:outer membrane receptor protein involved in Fe transport
MKTTRCTWALAALSALASADPGLAFRGRVVDPEGQPQAGATVYVVGRPGEAVTDADGRFEWRPDPGPPFEILVVLRGGTYSKPALIERLDPETPVEVTVRSAASEVMVVSGSAPSIESTPAAGTTTLTAGEITARQPSNLVQVLEGVAGVSQVSEGQAAVPAVRGLSAGRTLILIDGARVTSERRVGPSATFVDPAVLESVDVSRGPGAVAYGSDALGGVISLRTRRVEPGSPWQARATGTIGGEGKPEQHASMTVSKGSEAGGVLINAHAREADDWRGPEGPVFNSGFRDHGVLVRGERDLGRGVLTAGWQGDFARDVERPRNNSTTVRFYYPQEESQRLTASYELHHVAGFSRLAVGGFLGSYDQTTEQDRYATATSGRSIERAIVSAHDFHLRGSAERLFRRARLDLGLDVNGRLGLEALEGRIAYDLSGRESANVTTVAIGDAERVDAGVYASLDVDLAPRLSLGAGLRGDHVTTENTGGFFGDRATAHDAASGFLSLTAGSFHGFSVTAQLARGFRDPTLSDRYYRGPTGRGFITGNPDLDPETSRQLDLALRYAGGRLRVAAFYYRYAIDDLIERFETDPDVFLFRNRGRARIEGFELEAQADLGAGFSLELAAQTSEGRALDDDSYLDGIPPVTLSAQLRRQFDRASVQLRVAITRDDDRPGPTEREVSGTTTIDLTGSYRLARWLELRAIARNLLDEEYLASESTRAVPAPGRSFALVAALDF